MALWSQLHGAYENPGAGPARTLACWRAQPLFPLSFGTFTRLCMHNIPSKKTLVEWVTNQHLSSTSDMPGPVTYTISFSPQTSEEIIIIPISQVKKWKLQVK